MRLPSLKRLIELRVRSFIDSAPGSAEFKADLIKVIRASRERKHVQALFPGPGAAT
jgi:hypothetical protein